MNTRCIYGLVTLLLALQAQLGVAGSNKCECEDVAPKGETVSCLEQKLYGKCFVDWMIAGGYCAKTCGTCQCDKKAQGLGSPAVESEEELVVFKSSEDDEVVVQKTVRTEEEVDACDPDCTDVAPDDEFTCTQQASFGKCQSIWMIKANYCAASCGRCVACNNKDAKTSTLKKECDDIAPTDELTCEEQLRFKKCNRDWMIEGGYCRKSCGHCNDKKTAQTPKEQDPISIFEDLLAKALSPKTNEEEAKKQKKEEKEEEIKVEPVRIVEISVTSVSVPEEEKEEPEPVLIEEDKKEKVRQDMQALLAQNSEMDYMQVLGFELSRSVMDAIRDDFESEEAPTQTSSASVEEPSKPQIAVAPAPEVETAEVQETLSEVQPMIEPVVEYKPESKYQNVEPIIEETQTVAKDQVVNIPTVETESESESESEVTAPEEEEASNYEEVDESALLNGDPRHAIFGSGALKELAEEVPELANRFGDAALGSSISEEVDMQSSNSTSEVEPESPTASPEEVTYSSIPTTSPLLANLPQAPKRQLSKPPTTSQSLETPEVEETPQVNLYKSTACKSTILEEVSMHPELSLLSSILQELDLNGILSGEGSPVTLLAPDNRSLNNLLEASNVNLSSALTKDSPVLNSLKHLILYHTLDIPFDSEAMSDIAIANTKLGPQFPLYIEGSGRERVVFEAMHSVGQIKVKNAVEACGSVVHIIEGVLMPYKNLEAIPTHEIEVSQFLSPPPPPPSPIPSPVPTPSPKPIPSPACHDTTPTEILREHDEISTFVDFMKTFGMLDRLEVSTIPVTLFIPTNEAVLAAAKQLGSDEENLFNDFLSERNFDLVTSILGYHVIPNDRAALADLDEDRPLETAQGGMLFPEEAGSSSQVFIQGLGSTSKVTKGNVDGGSCLVAVHFIDAMMFPFAAGSVTLNSTLNSPKECQDELLPGVPSCDDVVRAGLCNDQGVKDGGYCMKSCGLCSNSIEATIKEDIVLESDAISQLKSSQAKKEEQCLDLSQFLRDFKDLSIFKSILTDNIDPTVLQQENSVTIFAPDDAAFRSLLNLPEGQALSNSNQDVKVLLDYHIVEGRFGTKDLTKGNEISTLAATSFNNTTFILSIDRSKDDEVVIQGIGSEAKITSSDINLCQGVLHIVDNVLLPMSHNSS